MVGWGIRAEWTGALLLVALLRHAVRERCLPPDSMQPRVELWPAGPSLVTELPAEFAGRLSWDPSAESKSVARQHLHRTIDGWLGEIEEVHVGLGHTTSKLRTVQRDAEATYLRLRDPRTWTWSALHDRYSDADRRTQISGNGIKQAITRVAAVIGVELPEIARGHPARLSKLQSALSIPLQLLRLVGRAMVRHDSPRPHR